jgi:hypothetical protein
MKIEGALEYFNYSPKGGYEALILATKKGEVQINFEPEHAADLACSLKAGEMVTVKVNRFDEASDAERPVYQLHGYKVHGIEHKPQTHMQVKGVVKRLNHTRHGEVNGGVLDTGDFIHLKPRGARAIQLAVGQTITASGQARAMLFEDYRVIEVEKANGVDLMKLDHAKKAAKKGAKKAPKKATKKHPK